MKKKRTKVELHTPPSTHPLGPHWPFIAAAFGILYYLEKARQTSAGGAILAGVGELLAEPPRF